MSQTKRQSKRDYRDRQRNSGAVRDWSICGDAIEKLLLDQVDQRQREERAKRRAANPSSTIDASVSTK